MTPEEWEALKNKVRDCRKCEIRQGCTQTVFGTGRETPGGMMLVGEAPGETEDLQGVPFVGQAGKILDRVLMEARIPRAEVFIANVLKCRPPDNRLPHKDEVQNCASYLLAQLAYLKPKIIVALGAEAAAVLLSPTGRKVTITSIRGTVVPAWPGKVLPTWHPSYYLRTQSKVVLTEMVRDLKKAKKIAEAKNGQS